MVSILDIARRANVSVATVSKVVNSRPDVGKDTCAHVLGVMAELNYQRRRPGRPLGSKRKRSKARRTRRIALLVSGVPRAQINSPVYMEVLHGVEAAVRDADMSFMLTHLPSDAPCPKDIFPQKVDGVILFGPVIDERLKAKLLKIPCVQVMGSIEKKGWCDHVSYDACRIGEIAADYLLGRGHRKAAYVSSTKTKSHLVIRANTFRDRLVRAGGTCLELVDTELLDDSGGVQQVNTERLTRLLDQIYKSDPSAEIEREASESSQQIPTSLFLVADILAPAVCSEVVRLGRNVEIISCNNEQMLLSHLNPRPATIDIHAEQVGRKAVQQLLWRIEYPDYSRQTTALTPTLVPAQPPASFLSSTPASSALPAIPRAPTAALA